MRFTNIKQGLHGTFEADVIINGMKFERKTFFPRPWNQEKVTEKIFESLQNLNKIPKKEGPFWILEGFTNEGIEIRSIVNQSGKITSNFPIGFKK